MAARVPEPVPGRHPVVGVVVPVHDDAALLGPTLQHLLTLGIETGTALDVVVADDGSPDGSADVAAAVSDRIRVLRLPHRGVSATRNAGLEALTTEVVAMLDADDRFTAALFTTLLPEIARPDAPPIVQGLLRDWRPAADACGGAVPDESTLGKAYRSINLGAALYRRAVFASVGGFDESYERHEDYDWYLRAYDRRVLKQRVDVVTLHYRRRPDGLSARGAATDPTRARIHGAAIRRRRSGLAPVPAALGSPADYFGAPPDEGTGR